MNKLIKIAKKFETKLQALAEASDAKSIVSILHKYELTSEFLDSLLEGLHLNLNELKADAVGNEDYMKQVNIIQEQTDLIESAIMSVYPQISALDAKSQELSILTIKNL